MRANKRKYHCVLPHPLGIMPDGNLWLKSYDNTDVARRPFDALTDENVLDTLNFLDGEDVLNFMCVSRYSYAYGAHEDIWMDFVLNEFDGDFTFDRLWRYTWVKRRCIQRKGPHTCTITTPDTCIAKGVYSSLLYERWGYVNYFLGDNIIDFANTIDVKTVDDLTFEEFLNCYEIPGKPLIIKGGANKWKAMTKWNRDFFVNEFDTTQLLQAGPAKMSFDMYFKYCDSAQDETPLFIFDPTFCELQSHTHTHTHTHTSLGTDFQVPEYFQHDLFSLLGHRRPDFRWLLVGNKGSGSKWHIDPNGTHAWNAVTAGCKRWLFCRPKTPPYGVYPSKSGADVTQPISLADWFANFYYDTKRDGAEFGLLEGVCEAGDIMFVPSQWWHCVVNTHTPTIAVTQNYVSQHSNLDYVRCLLKHEPEKVSGVDKDNRDSLWEEFDMCLKENRKQVFEKSENRLKEKKMSIWDRLKVQRRTLIIH